MRLEKFRWSRVYESSEEELVDLLKTRGMTATRHHIEEFGDMGGLNFQQDTTWWCADGSMTLVFAEIKFSLQAGDSLRIPANNAFTGTAGISGCTYYEASLKN
jgi:hypothetical protein